MIIKSTKGQWTFSRLYTNKFVNNPQIKVALTRRRSTPLKSFSEFGCVCAVVCRFACALGLVVLFVGAFVPEFVFMFVFVRVRCSYSVVGSLIRVHTRKQGTVFGLRHTIASMTCDSARKHEQENGCNTSGRAPGVR